MRYEEHGDLNKSVIIITMDIVDMCDLIMICFISSLKDFLEKNDSTSESMVWEFLVDLTLVSTAWYIVCIFTCIHLY